MATEGNENALKWNEEKTLEILEEMSTNIARDLDCYTLAGAIRSVDLYPTFWAYITDFHRDNTLVIEAVKGIEKQLEDRIVRNVMTGEGKSASMGIFLLKNKHGYVDKKEVEQSGNQTIKVISPTPLPDVNGWDKTGENV